MEFDFGSKRVGSKGLREAPQSVGKWLPGVTADVRIALSPPLGMFDVTERVALLDRLTAQSIT